MPEITREQLIKLNKEAEKRGIPLIKPNNNLLSRGLGTDAPSKPIDAIGRHMLQNAPVDAPTGNGGSSFQKSYYTTGEKLAMIQARQSKLVEQMKTASTKSFRNPSVEPKDNMYFRPTESDRDKLLAQYIEAAKEDKTIRDADQRMRSLAFTIGQGQLPEAKEQVKKIDNMINNNHKTLGNWDGAKDLNTFKDNIILKEYGVNDDLIKEYQNHINTNPAIASSNTKLLFKLAEIGAARKNMDAAEYNALYNDENFLNFKRELQAGNKDALTGPAGYAALSAFRDVLTKAYQIKYKPLIDKLNTLTDSPEDLKLRGELQAQIDKGNKELKAFDSRINTSEYAKIKRANDAALREAEDNIFAEGAARLRNVAVGVLSNVGVLNEAGSLKETDFALDFRTQPMRWHTGEFDVNGNPVMSDAVLYDGADGSTSLGLGGLFEAATTQAVQMYMTAGLTKVLAGVGGAIANVGKGAGFMKAARATQAELLNSEIGVRALTFPAVYMTTYPRTYYENIGNFKSTRELKDYAQASSMMEAGSESFIPDYNVVRGLKMNLPTNLSADQLKFYAKYLSDVAKGVNKKQTWLTFKQTVGSTFNKTFQEAIVEEELNYAAGALYQNYQSNGGQDNNYRNTQDYSIQGAIDLALEGTLTMLPGMVFPGAGRDYKHFAKQNNYNLTKPGSLSYHRWNVAANANYFREEIAKDQNIPLEDKAKINNAINEYEDLLKQAASVVRKPDEKTLGNDEQNIYMYFDAISKIKEIEPKILAEIVSEEDKQYYEDAKRVVFMIDQENKDWAKLSPEQKQKKWFKWYGESLSDRGTNNLKKTTNAQLVFIDSQEKKVNKLKEDGQIPQEIYDMYMDKISKAKSSAISNSLELFNENMANLEAPEISSSDVLYMAKAELPRAKVMVSDDVQKQEEWYKEQTEILKQHFIKKYNAEQEEKKKIEAKEETTTESTTATTTTVEETPKEDKFKSIKEAKSPRDRKLAAKEYFEAIPSENLESELEEFVATSTPDKLEAYKEAMSKKNWNDAKLNAPAVVGSFIDKLSRVPVEYVADEKELAELESLRAKRDVIEEKREAELATAKTADEKEAVNKKYDDIIDAEQDKIETEWGAALHNISPEYEEYYNKMFNARLDAFLGEEEATEEEEKEATPAPDIEAKKADIERRKQALRDLMKATGDDIFMLGVEDGTFMGEALLNMNENGDVILTRYADSEEGLTKGKGKTKNLKDIAGQFGGEQIATSGIEGGAASFVNGVVGEYHIPLQELIDLIKSEDVVFAGLGNKEFVLSPHIADKYLTKINGKQINAKYDAKLKALEERKEETKTEQPEAIPADPIVLITPSQFPAEEEWEWSMNARPTSGLISISDEYTSEGERIDSDFSRDINEFINNQLKGQTDKYKAELISNSVLFKREGVNVKKIQKIINDFWNGEKTEENKKEAIDELTKEFKGLIGPSSIAWHLSDDITKVNEGAYGLKDVKNKFRDVTMKSFTMTVMDGNKALRSGPRQQPIVRALPKVYKDGENYEFYSILPLSNVNIQEDLKTLYNLQEWFKSDEGQNDSKEITLDKVSNGFDQWEGVTVRMNSASKVELVKENRPGLKVGMIVDSEGRSLLSDTLDESDVNAISHMLMNSTEAAKNFEGATISKQRKAMVEYIRSVVWLTDEDVVSLLRLRDETKIKDALSKMRYNVKVKKLDEIFVHWTMDGENLSSKKRQYKAFVLPHLYRWEVKKDIRGGNKKIYFSLKGDVKEVASPLVSEVIAPAPKATAPLDETRVIETAKGPRTVKQLTDLAAKYTIEVGKQEKLLELANSKKKTDLAEEIKGSIELLNGKIERINALLGVQEQAPVEEKKEESISDLEKDLSEQEGEFEAEDEIEKQSFESALAEAIEEIRLGRTPAMKIIDRLRNIYGSDLVNPHMKEFNKAAKEATEEHDEDKPAPFDPMDALTFSSSIEDSATIEEEQDAYTWFVKSFLSEDFELNLNFTDNPQAFATFTDTAFTLFSGSNYTMLYHEAWHRFTQHYLSKEEKRKLYAAVKSLFSEKNLSPSEFRKYEEALAEAFRDYMKGDKKTITLSVKGKPDVVISLEKPKEKHSLIARLFNGMKSILNKLFPKEKTANDLIIDYIKQASSPTTLRKSDVKNSYFETLNSGRKYEFELNNGGSVTFDYAALYEIEQAIDYMFVDSFDRFANRKIGEKPVYDKNGEILGKEKALVMETEKEFQARTSTKNAITTLLAQSADQRETIAKMLYEDVFSKLVAERSKLITEEGEILDAEKVREFTAIIDNFYTHFVKETGAFRQSLVGKFKKDLDEKIEELKDEDSKVEFGEVFENMSNYEHADEAIINAVRILPRLDADGNPLLSDYWGLPQLDNFNRNWTILAKNLAGLEFPQMVEKLKELSSPQNGMPAKYPQFKYLLRSINTDYQDGKLTPIVLRNKFQQVFNMASVSEMLTILSKDKRGSTVVKFIESGTDLPKSLQRQWDADFRSRFQEITEGDTVLNITRLLEAYPENKLSTIEGNLEFLEDIGIIYTNPDQVLSLLEKNNGAFFEAVAKIYKKLDMVNKQGIPVVFPLETIRNSHQAGRRNIRGESSSLDVLAKLEIETDESLSDDQILRADGNSAWRYMQNTYITQLTNDLKRFEYEQLKKIYPQLDVEKNPEIANSHWFNSLFLYNEETLSYDKTSNSLSFLRIGGMKADEIAMGEVTIDLNASDKLLMDFYSFVNSQVEESVRFADKSMAGAIRLSAKEGFKITDEAPIVEQIIKIRKQIAKQIVGEVAGIQYLNSIPEEERKKLKWYNSNYSNMQLIYGAMVDKDLQAILLTAKLKKEIDGWELVNPKIQAALENEINKYFKGKAAEFKDKFEEAHGRGIVDKEGNLVPIDYSRVLPEQLRKENENKVFEYYYSYSTLNRIEQFNFIYGSPRNFKDGDDVFKRVAAYGAVGKYAAIDKEFLNWTNKQKEYQRNIEALYNKGAHREWTEEFTSVHFKDVPVKIEEYSQDSLYNKKSKLYNPKYSDSERKQLSAYYDLSSKETDGAGNCTLDFYRQFLLSIGEWNNRKQNAYNLQLEFERAKLEFQKKGSTAEHRTAFEAARRAANNSIGDLTSIFNIKKLQYSGSIYSNNPDRISSKMDVRAFEKFAVNPFIPSVIYGTKWEKVAINMYTTHTDMTNFDSGSKANWDAPLEDMNDWVGRKVIKFTPTTLSLRSLKEQVPIADEMKEEGIFASQMRKLLSVGLFERGGDIKGREEAIQYYKEYKQAVGNITEMVKAELALQFSSPKKLVEYIKKEFDRREIPDHVAEFVQYYEKEGQLKDKFDLSFQSFQLQNILFSIVNNKIVKQKLSGGQFIQAPNTGYTNATLDDIKKYNDSNLKTYSVDPLTNKVQPMEIKIAFTKKYYGLLDIEWNGEKLAVYDVVEGSKPILNIDRSIAKLNEALLDADFVNKHGKKFTLVGCRIPVQGFSTIESMRVKQFLPPVAGQIVIVPSGLTVKSGGDFDIDKLNIYEPKINKGGELASTDEANPVEKYKTIVSTLDKNNTRLKEIHSRIYDIKNPVVTEEEEKAAEKANTEVLSSIKKKKAMSLEDLQEMHASIKESSISDETNAKKAAEDEELSRLWDESNTLNEENTKLSKEKRNLLPSQINALISSVSNLILDRGNFENLMTRNETDYLNVEYAAREVDKIKTPLSSVIDPIVSNRVFEKNTVGKASLGIDAKANTFFALALEAGLKITNPSPSILRRNVGKDGALSLSTIMSRSSSYVPKTKEEIEFYEKNKDHFGALYIPKVISEFISGHVDIAKDSRIAEIRADRLRTPIYLYMIMSGTHLHDAIEFLNQPHILKLVEDYNRQDSLIYKNYVTNEKGEEKAAPLLSKNKILRDAVSEKSFSEAKEFQVKSPSGQVDHYATAKAILEKPNLITRRELVDIAQFIVLLEDQRKFKTLTSAVSWDTNTSKNFVEMNYPKLQLSKMKKEEWFNKEALEHFENESVIASLEPSDFVNEFYSQAFEIISKPAFIDATLELYSSTYGASLENFSRDFQNDFFTFLYQNFASEANQGSSYEYLLNELLLLNKDNENNIQQRWNRISSRIDDRKFENNAFVKMLIFSKHKNSNIIVPELKNSSIDPHTANLIHQDLLKLLNAKFDGVSDEDNIKIRTITKAIVDSAALHSGVNKTFRGFQALMPTDTYTKLFRDLLSSPKLQEQLNNVDAPPIAEFEIYERNDKGRLSPTLEDLNLYQSFFYYFQQNRKKYFPKVPKLFEFDPMNRYNYFDPNVREGVEIGYTVPDRTVEEIQEPTDVKTNNLRKEKQEEVEVEEAAPKEIKRRENPDRYVNTKMFEWNRPSRKIGTDADVEMREMADGIIAEIYDYKQDSSSKTSLNKIINRTRLNAKNINSTYAALAKNPGEVMLARNTEFNRKALSSGTLRAIDAAYEAGAVFIVGNMPGVDTQFIEYLDEIGASYTIYGHEREVIPEAKLSAFDIVRKPVSTNTISYTPKGKEKQVYTIKGTQIFNKENKEVFKEESLDRNKIFANFAVKEGRAVVVEYKNKTYIVNNKGRIISGTTGKLMEWANNHGDRKAVTSIASTLMANKDILNSKEFNEWYIEELERDPSLTEEAAIEFYKKCK